MITYSLSSWIAFDCSCISSLSEVSCLLWTSLCWCIWSSNVDCNKGLWEKEELQWEWGSPENCWGYKWKIPEGVEFRWVCQNIREKLGFPGGLMQKKWKFLRGHDIIAQCKSLSCLGLRWYRSINHWKFSNKPCRVAFIKKKKEISGFL